MDDLAQLRNFRAGLAPPTGAVRERARRAWKDDVRPTTSHASRRLGVRFAVALATVTALVTVSIVVVNHLVDQRVAEIPRVSLGKGTLDPVGAGDYPQNVLILGTDAQPQEPDPAANGSRSDTMILLRVRRHSADAVWFPRDLLVQIPGQPGMAPLGQAYMFGGPQLAIDTFKANFDVDVNHYVELDMRAMRDVVDELGGIRVSFPEQLRDEYSGLQVDAGCVRLDGTQALALARSRHAEAFRDGAWQLVDVRSELDRVQRQVDLVGLFRAAVRTEVDHRPLRLTRLVDDFLNRVKLDATFNRQEILQAARVLLGIDPARFHTSVLPIAVAPTDPNRLAVAAEGAATLQRLGASAAPSALPAVPPGNPNGLRAC
jgi:LCP family protein required for cell wall assembly